jgi:NAD(P)-dependent dehydrogenase (short-subunit alcohol dehydrogenase family)
MGHLDGQAAVVAGTAQGIGRAIADLLESEGAIVHGRSVSLTGIQAYTSAKAGQIGFTRQMAHELGQHGITVNCIAPGFVLSNPTTQAQWDSYARKASARWPSASPPAGPARRMTSPAACCSSRRRTSAGSAGRRSPSTPVTRSLSLF